MSIVGSISNRFATSIVESIVPSFGNVFGNLTVDPNEINIDDEVTITFNQFGIEGVFTVDDTTPLQLSEVNFTFNFNTYTYQWQKNGVNLADGGDISGSTTSVLTISNFELSDEANYTLIVTNVETSQVRTFITFVK